MDEVRIGKYEYLSCIKKILKGTQIAPVHPFLPSRRQKELRSFVGQNLRNLVFDLSVHHVF